jgi:uncharacterized membrane protein
MALDIIYEYFVKPIISPETQGYNLVNTAIYIILLVIACTGIYFTLKKKIVFDKKFFLALVPYILFGISMRVIMHQIESGLLTLPQIFKTANPLEIGFWFFTPGIWILTFAIVLIGLVFGKVWEKLNYKRFIAIGLIAAIPPLIFNLMHFNNWIPFLLTAIIIVIASYGLCWIINKYTKYKILNEKLNLFIVSGQAIDGISSSIAITFFGFGEQHVFSNLLLNISPLAFIGAKLFLAVMIAWSLDDYLNDAEQKLKKNPKKLNEKKNLVGFIKVIIAVLGFATGLASLFKLGII